MRGTVTHVIEYKLDFLEQNSTTSPQENMEGKNF